MNDNRGKLPLPQKEKKKNPQQIHYICVAAVQLVE